MLHIEVDFCLGIVFRKIETLGESLLLSLEQKSKPLRNKDFLTSASFYAFFKPKEASNLSLYSLYYAEVCNELARPIFTSLRLKAAQFLLNKFYSGSEPLATLRPISPTQDLNLWPPTLETNALPLDQLAVPRSINTLFTAIKIS